MLLRARYVAVQSNVFLIETSFVAYRMSHRCRVIYLFFFARGHWLVLSTLSRSPRRSYELSDIVDAKSFRSIIRKKANYTPFPPLTTDLFLRYVVFLDPYVHIYVTSRIILRGFHVLHEMFQKSQCSLSPFPLFLSLSLFTFIDILRKKYLKIFKRIKKYSLGRYVFI